MHFRTPVPVSCVCLHYLINIHLHLINGCELLMSHPKLLEWDQSFTHQMCFKIVLTKISTSYAPLWKNGPIVLHLFDGWPVCVDQVMSTQYLLTPLLESCQSWYSGSYSTEQMFPFDFQVIWSKVNFKLLVFKEMLFNQYL